jgi:hypothetical protein
MSNRTRQVRGVPFPKGVIGEAGRHDASRQVREAGEAFPAGDLPAALRNHGRSVDAHARAVLKRLAESGCPSQALTAAEAIVSTLPREGWDRLFADCIVAEWKARNHGQWIRDQQGVLDRAVEADKALDLAARFLRLPKGAADSPDPDDEALWTLRRSVEMRRCLADEHLKLYSRKTTPEACRAVGVGWILETLEALGRRYGCKTEPRPVAAIATAALNMGDVTEDAARKAPRFMERLDSLADEHLKLCRSGAFEG